MNDQIIAAIKTGTAALGTLIVIGLVKWLAGYGIDIEVNDNWAIAIAGLLFAVAVGVYNLVANWAIARYPGLKFLLGSSKTPNYSAPTGGNLYQPGSDEDGWGGDAPEPDLGH